MATAKYLTSRGWSKTDRKIISGWQDACKYDIEQMELCRGIEWNNQRVKRIERRNVQIAREKQSKRLTDENIMFNGGLWVEPGLTETDIRLEMITYTGNASMSSMIRHKHTNYDKIRKTLNNDVSKKRYRAMINQRIYEMYPWSKED